MFCQAPEAKSAKLINATAGYRLLSGSLVKRMMNVTGQMQMPGYEFNMTGPASHPRFFA